MATLNQASDSTISGKAMELLDCFVAGLDDAILEYAKLIARRRQGNAEIVDIEAEDIVEAADLLFGSLRDSLGKDPSKAQGLKLFEDMYQCLKTRCETQAVQGRLR